MGWIYRGGRKRRERSETRADLCFFPFPDDLFEKLDFRDADPEIIDLSSEDGMVSTLQESKIECMSNEKVSSLSFLLLSFFHLATRPFRGLISLLPFASFRTSTSTTSSFDTPADPSSSSEVSTVSDEPFLSSNSSSSPSSLFTLSFSRSSD